MAKVTTRIYNEQEDFDSRKTLEERIPGFETVKVSGRESLAKDLDTLTVGSSDGVTLTDTKWPERVITVDYLIKDHSEKELQRKQALLEELLNVENTNIYFSDSYLWREGSSFSLDFPHYIGTPVMDKVQDYKGCIAGTFKVMCHYPHLFNSSYSGGLNEIDSREGFGHSGNLPSYPTIKIKFADAQEGDEYTRQGDCGYVSILRGLLPGGATEFTDTQLLTFGNIEETDLDEEYFEPSQTLINRKLTQKTNFDENTGGALYGSKYQVGGTLTTGSTGLKGGTFGTGDKYHGPYAHWSIPADRFGEIGATNFRFSFKLSLACSSTKQRGCFQAYCKDESNKTLAIISIEKNTADAKATCSLAYNNGSGGKTIRSFKIDVSPNNKKFGKGSACTITKSGKKLTWEIAGSKYTWNDRAIANTKCTGLMFYFGRYKTYNAISTNIVSKITFIKDMMDTAYNVPNTFTAGDVLEIDCKSGKVYLNGEEAPQLGSIDNDYERFTVLPYYGVHDYPETWFALQCSDWTAEGFTPTAEMRWEEVYI